MLKYIYFVLRTPFIFLQKIISKILNIKNSHKINERFHLSGILFFKKELNYLKDNNIGIFINLASEFPFKKRNQDYCKKHNILYKEYLVVEGMSPGAKMLNQIELFIRQNPTKKIFINCASGVGRSVFLLIHLLIKTNQVKTIKEAKEIILNVRPGIFLTKKQLNGLKESLKGNKV